MFHMVVKLERIFYGNMAPCFSFLQPKIVQKEHTTTRQVSATQHSAHHVTQASTVQTQVWSFHMPIVSLATSVNWDPQNQHQLDRCMVTCVRLVTTVSRVHRLQHLVHEEPTTLRKVTQFSNIYCEIHHSITVSIPESEDWKLIVSF